MSGLWGVRHSNGAMVLWGADPAATAWFAYTHRACCVLVRETDAGWVEVPFAHPGARCAVCDGFATRVFEIEQADGRWTRMTCDNPGCLWDAGEPLSERPLTVSEAEAISGDDLSGVTRCAS